jgi:putative glycosyltransferase (TIGR04372 family)
MLKLLKKIFLYLYFKYNLLVLLPHPTAIGNCSEEIYEAIKIASLKNKKILLILPIYINLKFLPIKTLNPKIFDIESKYFLLKPLSLYLIPLRGVLWIFFIPIIIIIFCLRGLGANWIKSDFYPYFGTFLLFNTLRDYEIMKFDFEDAVNEKKLRALNSNVDIGLSKRIKLAGSKFIKEINMPENAWHVCIHVRNSEYYNDSKASPYRNANISNYFDLINSITEKGGWVFRLGNSSMPKLNRKLLVNPQNVVDLANSHLNEPEVNAWLIAKCNCYIGMQSGPYDYARLFCKPIILVNMYSPFFGIDNQENIIGIFKEFREKNSNLIHKYIDVIQQSYFNPADFSPLNYTQRELSNIEILKFAARLVPYRLENFKELKERRYNNKYDRHLKTLIIKSSENKYFTSSELFRWVQRSINAN